MTGGKKGGWEGAREGGREIERALEEGRLEAVAGVLDQAQVLVLGRFFVGG